MLHGYRLHYSLHKNKGIAKDAETKFDTSNYELERPLPKEKHKRLSD